MNVRFTTKNINFVPEVEADWAGMARAATRIMYALAAVNVGIIVYVIATH